MPPGEKISIQFSFFPELNAARLICGLPGSGFVGKLAVDYLIETLHATQFADIYSSSFPPQVTIQSDGTVDLVKNSLFFTKNNSQDLVFLTGDAQPISAPAEYALAEEILTTCNKLKVNSIITLAAYITGNFSKNPKVYGTSTSLDIVKDFSKYGILTMNSGSIVGMNGVIIGTAKKFNIPGTCILGETSGYVIDAKASKAILEKLSMFLNIQFDMSEISKRAEDTEQIIKSIELQANSQASSGKPIAIPSSENKNLDYIS
jgi:hypothetical protein